MTVLNQRGAPSPKTIEEFIALLPEYVRERTRAELLGNPSAWAPQQKPVQTTFLDSSAPREK